MARVSIPFGMKAAGAYWWLKSQEINFMASRSFNSDGTYEFMEFELEDEKAALELALRHG